MKYENQTHYIIPGNNFIIDGINRSLLYDLQRYDYEILPPEFSAAIKQNKSGNFKDLLAELPEEDMDFYEPLVAQLVEKDYLIPIEEDELQFFSPMSTEWSEPHPITAAVIEYAIDSPYDLEIAIHKLDEMGCQALEIRLVDVFDLSFFEKFRSMTDGRIFRHIDFFIKYAEGQDEDFMFSIKTLHPTFLAITQYGAPKEVLVKNKHDEGIGMRRKKGDYLTLTNNNEVKPGNFLLNMEFFLEAQQHNVYFNGKVIITRDGNVRNAWQSPVSFGNINDADLASIIEKKEFTEHWNVSKDNILVCKDCEYRYMCYDSRVPVRNSQGEWEYAESCNYDPYTCTWKNQD